MIAVRFLVFAAAILAVGCGKTTSAGRAHQASHYWLFFDESASVRDRQKANWPQEATRLAGRLQYGDAAEIDLIHARTADAAPQFRGAIPLFDENSPRDMQEAAKRELIRVRRDAKKAIAEAIHPTQSIHVNATDVFGVFDRFRPDPDRQNLILIFSDGLESADPRLNLERSCLAQMNLESAITDLAHRRRWHDRSLAGANVFFILPGVSSNDAKSCNDSGQLRAFYSMLIGAIGGNLVDFNTQWSQQ
jgi:hypothetical protein